MWHGDYADGGADDYTWNMVCVPTMPPPPPSIYDMYPAEAERGTSGYLTISGQYLSYATNVNVSGTGVSMYVSAILSDSQIEAGYSVDANASVGARTVTVTTSGGTSGGLTFNVTATPTVNISYASIPNDRITVELAPAGLSGTLTVQVVGAATHTVYQGTKSAGTHDISFNIPNLPAGEFTQVRATWAVGGAPEATREYHIKVLGVYEHTRYHSPSEGNCSGGSTPLTLYNNSCISTPNATMRGGFVDRVLNMDYGTGSGHSISYGDVQREAWCSPRPYPSMRRDVTIAGSYGPVNDSTVAVCPNSQLDVPGLQLYIHGLGVKTVTDRCPKCCQFTARIDNYTTDTSCWVGSLPNAKTIILY